MERRTWRKGKRAARTWLRNCSVTQLCAQVTHRESRSQDITADELGKPFPTTLRADAYLFAWTSPAAWKTEKQRSAACADPGCDCCVTDLGEGENDPLPALQKHPAVTWNQHTFIKKKISLNMFSPPLRWAALRLALRAQRLWEPRPAQVLWRTEGSSPTLAPERMGELLKGEGDTHQEPELPALCLTFPPAQAVERAGSGLNRRFSLWLIAQGQMRFLQDRQWHVVLGCFYSDNPTPSPTLSPRHPSKGFWGDRAT